MCQALCPAFANILKYFLPCYFPGAKVMEQVREEARLTSYTGYPQCTQNSVQELIDDMTFIS